MLPNTVERVSLNTSDEINQRIARETNRRVNFYAANPVGIDRRLRELDEEWTSSACLKPMPHQWPSPELCLPRRCTSAGSCFPCLSQASWRCRAGVRPFLYCADEDTARDAKSRPSASH